MIIDDLELCPVLLGDAISIRTNFITSHQVKVHKPRSKSLGEERMVFREAKTINDNQIVARNPLKHFLTEPPLTLGLVELGPDALTRAAIRIFAARRDLVIDDEAEPRICKTLPLKKTRRRRLACANSAG